MLFGLLGALCFCIGGFGSARISVAWGPWRANFARLCCSLVILLLAMALWQVFAKNSLPGSPPMSAIVGLLVAGALHFGIGDSGLMIAYRTLGPRRALVLAMVGASLTAVLMDVVTGAALPDWWRLALVAVAMLATAAAIDRQAWLQGQPAVLRRGIAAAALAALGQGAANGVAAVALRDVDIVVWQASALRLAGAIPVVLLAVVVAHKLGNGVSPASYALQDGRRRGASAVWPWLFVSATIGPVLGITAINAGLQAAGGATLTQAALLMLPLFMVPLAWWLDGDRPQARALLALGVVVASLMVAALA